MLTAGGSPAKPHAMSGEKLVVVAYGFLWGAVLLYVLSLWRRHARLRADIEELRRKILAK